MLSLFKDVIYLAPILTYIIQVSSIIVCLEVLFFFRKNRSCHSIGPSPILHILLQKDPHCQKKVRGQRLRGRCWYFSLKGEVKAIIKTWLCHQQRPLYTILTPIPQRLPRTLGRRWWQFNNTVFVISHTKLLILRARSWGTIFITDIIPFFHLFLGF